MELAFYIVREDKCQSNQTSYTIKIYSMLKVDKCYGRKEKQLNKDKKD